MRGRNAATNRKQLSRQGRQKEDVLLWNKEDGDMAEHIGDRLIRIGERFIPGAGVAGASLPPQSACLGIPHRHCANELLRNKTVSSKNAGL